MTLTILLSDCKEADYCNGYDCPLARALNRVIDPSLQALVGPAGSFMLWERAKGAPKNEEIFFVHGTLDGFHKGVVDAATKDFEVRVSL